MYVAADRPNFGENDIRIPVFVDLKHDGCGPCAIFPDPYVILNCDVLTYLRVAETDVDRQETAARHSDACLNAGKLPGACTGAN